MAPMMSVPNAAKVSMDSFTDCPSGTCIAKPCRTSTQSPVTDEQTPPCPRRCSR